MSVKIPKIKLATNSFGEESRNTLSLTPIHIVHHFTFF